MSGELLEENSIPKLSHLDSQRDGWKRSINDMQFISSVILGRKLKLFCSNRRRNGHRRTPITWMKIGLFFSMQADIWMAESNIKSELQFVFVAVINFRFVPTASIESQIKCIFFLWNGMILNSLIVVWIGMF
ncbi:conserved hypothetical protein [Ricinus communis]|uniref:Uncharacterized protein n=1 Tax=Ricinus communis TaxID=3988 RepID=B9SGB9_RICCO|nr:conserved hypothetical protein [Ricinus communis]